MKHDNPIRNKLEEVFKELIPDENAPRHLKDEVFQTLDTLNLFGDIADLFTDKFSKTEAAFLGVIQEDSDPEESDDNAANEEGESSGEDDTTFW